MHDGALSRKDFNHDLWSPLPIIVNAESPRIAYITAGSAGMYCGSCLRDNTLAAALGQLGVDVQLIPTYTPIRTDESDVSIDRVFFNGINVYLEQHMALFRYLPGAVNRMLDQPWLIRWATRGGIQTNPKYLGAMTVSMLRGTAGHQKREVDKLVSWLVGQARPQLVNLSNMLIAGFVPALKQALDVPVLVTLQGDDLFLDGLPEPYRSQAFAEIGRLVGTVDGFVVFSQYYKDFMSEYYGIPSEKLHLVRMGIRVEEFPRRQRPTPAVPARVIGYLARLCPDKGLHILIDAFIQLKKRPGMESVQLSIAGWLGKDDKQFAKNLFQSLRDSGLENDFQYHGVVDRQEKIEFLRSIDLLCVPTIYREPKGIYVLEALAAGVPVVQPDHGAFPELLKQTGGGCLVPPNDATRLAQTLEQLLQDPDRLQQLGREGQETVHRDFDAASMARSTLEVYREFLS